MIPASRLRASVGRLLGTLVDPLVVPSFDRTGFRIHSLGFDPSALEVDLSGRRALVTGANSGIGYETAKALAERGAEVELLCRHAARGQAAAERIRKETGNPRVSVVILDVSDLRQVDRVGARLAERAVDLLVHNAGVLPDERIETAEGLELTFATHVAGPFLLTRRLQPRLVESPDGRIVWVSSGGMYTRRLQVDDPQWRSRPYDGVIAYAETKRAQVVLAELFAEALRDAGVAVNAMHPGWADTPAVERSLPRFHRLTRAILRTPSEGADTVVWLAVSEQARDETGGFFFDRAPRSRHWLPGTRASQSERSRLWSICEAACAPFDAAGAADGRP